MILGTDTPTSEDPRKLEAFKQKLLGLKWESGNEAASLKELFGAVDALAHAEVLYYYSLRRRRSRWSGILRFLAWTLGTIGILLPLAAAAIPNGGAALSPWGYVALAAAAALLAANALLGASAGHVRFVTTQLSLEKLMTLSRLEWSSLESQSKLGPITPALLSKGFELIQKYAS